MSDVSRLLAKMCGFSRLDEEQKRFVLDSAAAMIQRLERERDAWKEAAESTLNKIEKMNAYLEAKVNEPCSDARRTASITVTTTATTR